MQMVLARARCLHGWWKVSGPAPVPASGEWSRPAPQRCTPVGTQSVDDAIGAQKLESGVAAVNPRAAEGRAGGKRPAVTSSPGVECMTSAVEGVPCQRTPAGTVERVISHVLVLSGCMTRMTRRQPVHAAAWPSQEVWRQVRTLPRTLGINRDATRLQLPGHADLMRRDDAERDSANRASIRNG